MKTLLFSISVFSISVLLASQAAGQSMNSNQARNAATWYQRAMDEANALRTSNPQLFELVFGYDPTQPPTPELRAALNRFQPILEMVRQGAQQEHCDFNLDRSQGFELMLPHLSKMREVAKVMRADAMVRLHDGDPTASANGLADMYRISSHFNDDRVLISSLVGQAVFSFADAGTAFGLDRGAFGEAQSEILLQGLERLNEFDPFDYLEAVAGEQEIFVGWIAERFSDLEKRPELIAGIGDADNEHAEQLLLLDEAGFRSAIDGYDMALSRAVEVFSIKDPAAAAEAMKELEAEIEQSMYGPLAGIMLPAFGKILENRTKAERMLADRRAVLQALSKGAAKPEDIANAALWYLRAIEMLERSTAPELELLRGFVDNPLKPVEGDLATAIAGEGWQSIIDVVREGSMKRRCDFTGALQRRSVDFIPAYAPGLNEVLGLFLADAARLLAADEEWDAVDRFATCIRVCAHVGHDTSMVSNLVAHANFNRALDLVNAAINQGTLPEECKPALGDALERISRRDPFGYIGSIIQAREQIAQKLTGPYMYNQEHRDRNARAKKLVQEINGDQALFMLAVIDKMERNASEAQQSEQPAPNQTVSTNAADQKSLVRRLRIVFSQTELDAAHNEISRIAPRLLHQEDDLLLDVNIPAIAHSAYARGIMDHLRRSRADIRQAQALLRVTADSSHEHADQEHAAREQVIPKRD